MSREDFAENVRSGYYLNEGMRYLEIDMEDVYPDSHSLIKEQEEQIQKLEQENADYEDMIDEVASIVS